MFGRVYRVRRDRHLLGYDGNHGLARLLQDRPRNQVVYAIACSVASSGVHAQLPGLRPSEVSSDLLNRVPALFVKLHKRRHLDRGTSRTHSGAQTCKAIHHSRFHRRTDE